MTPYNCYVRYWGVTGINIMKQDNDKRVNEEEFSESDFSKDLIRLLETLRRNELEWSEKADSLIAALFMGDTETAVSNMDQEMLSLVLEVALRGDDITETYPAFSRRLSGDDALQQALSDILAIIDAEQSQTALPPLPVLNLDFLGPKISIPATIIYSTPNQWHAAWQMVSDYLNQRFILSLATYRSGATLLDEDSTLLFHNEFKVGAQVLEATLEAIYYPHTPDLLNLFLYVTTDLEKLPLLEATLEWGPYQKTAVLDRYGQTAFPPFELQQILNDSNDTIIYGLTLDLHPILREL